MDTPDPALHMHTLLQVLEVSFTDGGTSRFSAELLRVCSPSAENCSEGANSKVGEIGVFGLCCHSVAAYTVTHCGSNGV
jgi:DUF971 family protein